MYTQCPECLSVFSLGAQALVQAHGYVMCGHCGAGFDSLATLSEQLPPEPFQELPRVGGEGLDVPPLPLGVERVEGQRALARTAQPGDHDQAVAGQVEVHPLEVVDADASKLHLACVFAQVRSPLALMLSGPELTGQSKGRFGPSQLNRLGRSCRF